jgi:pyoverdine/dityrosine biosynthesis protein Dit1/AcrR family transcriptional regulator
VDPNSGISKYRIGQAATALFLERGFDNVLMVDVARAASIEEVELYRHFGRKQDIVLSIYQSVNTDWRVQVAEFEPDDLASRFRRALTLKVELLKPYESFMASILRELTPSESAVGQIAINSPESTHIRAIGLQTIDAVANGSTDVALFRAQFGDLTALLFAMHWAVLLLHFRAKDKSKTSEIIAAVISALDNPNDASSFDAFRPFATQITNWIKESLSDPDPSVQRIDREILKVVFNLRKVSDSPSHGDDEVCATCIDLHESKIRYFTSQNQPIHFVLPAFPAKSPNTTKVLGSLPDLGEEIALVTLENLCKEIQSIYAPGAHVTICSDGRIFSELVGVTDVDVTKYVRSVQEMIDAHALQSVDIVNLEDLLAGDSFDELRTQVLNTYAEDLDELHARLGTNPEFKNMFNGIHRFISDDRRFLFPEVSATKVKEQSKPIALKVIQHSNAWTRFLGNVYPTSVRISIHPYPSHSDKIGVRLTRATDNWITPWHGVIVLQNDGYVLMKRSEAEAIGATLVLRDGRPYFYSTVADTQ